MGLDQAELAARAGISRRSLAAYERGETSVPPPKRVKIEQALQKRRVELGYHSYGLTPTPTVTDRLRTLEVLNLRLLTLMEQVLERVSDAKRPPPQAGSQEGR